MATKKNILQVLNWLDLNTDRDLDETRIPLFMQVLADLPDEVLKPAALAYASRSRYFPHPSELRQEALALLADAHSTPTEFEAWGEVQTEIERSGYLGEPAFSHSLIGKAVNVFGWQYLCLSTERTIDRAHFLKAYRTLLGKHTRRLALPEAVKQYFDRGTNTLPAPREPDQAQPSSSKADMKLAPGK